MKFLSSVTKIAKVYVQIYTN